MRVVDERREELVRISQRLLVFGLVVVNIGLAPHQLLSHDPWLSLSV